MKLPLVHAQITEAHAEPSSAAATLRAVKFAVSSREDRAWLPLLCEVAKMKAVSDRPRALAHASTWWSSVSPPPGYIKPMDRLIDM
jgi:hypothetical protein